MSSFVKATSLLKLLILVLAMTVSVIVVFELHFLHLKLSQIKGRKIKIPVMDSKDQIDDNSINIAGKDFKHPTPAAYIQCRHTFLRQIQEANLIFSNEQEPAPTSMFIKHERVAETSLEKTYLYIVTFGRWRRSIGTGHQPPGKCNWGIDRTKSWVDWIYKGTLWAKWRNGISKCQLENGTVSAVQYKESVVYKCLLQGYVKNGSFNLSMSRDEKVVSLGEDLMPCNYPISPKRKFRLVASVVITDYQMDRLPEMIEYHSLVGFEHFFIYVAGNNFTKYYNLVKVYVEDLKIVTLSPCYTTEYERLVVSKFRQPASYQDTLYQMKGVADWIGIYDGDELFRLLPSNRYKSKNWPDFLDAQYKEVKKTSKNASLPGLTCLSWNYAFPKEVNSKPCKSDGLYSRITSMNFRDHTTARLRFKAFARTDEAVYAFLHVIYSATGFGTYNTGERRTLISEEDGFVGHFRPVYIGGGSLVQDKDFRSEFEEPLFERLKSHGFVDFQREKRCPKGDPISKSVFADACSNNNRSG